MEQRYMYHLELRSCHSDTVKNEDEKWTEHPQESIIFYEYQCEP